MIDWIYVFIIIIALAIFFMNLMNRPEGFTNFPPKYLGVNYGAPSPQQFASNGTMPAGFSKWKSGYSRFGATPPRPRCNVTVMGEQCNNLPTDNLGNNQTVCQSSYNTYPTGNRGFKYPLYVMGKALGRVRQCRNLYNPNNKIVQ